ncbi:hypothetical protein RhiirA5_416918 [Rhizophagus irregularis]|uniref:Transposase Tc1-like domain-containing protein n=1 Tax=Rhizophagus irregularis TaxID=588596 RepID=A0A2N0PNL8_9GLOM|nr:hypothetical protein RhiirA5_416918 [Rhizophagus irregularis]
MVKIKELTDFEREKVIGYYEASDTEKAISEKTGYGKTTIHNIIIKYHKTGAITVAPRKNLRKIFTASTGNNVSRSTIQRTLYGMDYNSCTVLRKPSVSEHNRKIRLN